jgi:hypothetical protein
MTSSPIPTATKTPTPGLSELISQPVDTGVSFTIKGHHLTLHYPDLATIDQVFMYLGILLGVIFSASVQQAQKGGPLQVNVSKGMVATSAVIALLVMPYVFRQSIDPTSPFLVRFGLFVQNGVFWQVALGAASKLAGVTAGTA